MIMAITVLIPVYQAEKYLSRCLDSVLNQTFSFWKAILLDDGSTDNSRVIMDDYMKRDVEEGVREISLSTCNNDSSHRLII